MKVESRLERFSLWGGIECSVTRIGDIFNDQLERSGHARRIEDLSLIKELGISVLRYPILWERTVGYRGHQPNWNWNDERLEKIAALDITPIVGLLHHGSGPIWTSLVDKDFPKYFAEYAYQVASRYPWIECYTPINEPLTTARFSGLYGHWYPHGRSDLDFVKILANQCEGISLAMEAIRSVNPNAKLIQTEDLGSISSTPPLKYQADFENARRWLSMDILTGKFDEKHKLIPYLNYIGTEDRILNQMMVKYPAPDILGFNHYITSSRFLDHRHWNYPEQCTAWNGKSRYADVELVRVGWDEMVTLDTLLREAWDRYQLPLALTEAHLTCACDEQIRWLANCWDTASLLLEDIDIRGVTAWALFGLYDWDTLTVERNHNYESGVFDVTDGTPRATPLAGLVEELAKSGNYCESAVCSDGWWERPERIFYPKLESS